MERRKLIITLSLAVLIPCVLYIAGIIAQFMININAWKAAGSDFSVSPGLPSLELADVNVLRLLDNHVNTRILVINDDTNIKFCNHSFKIKY